MEMVSATKLAKALQRVENARPYFDSMDMIVSHLMASISEDDIDGALHPLMIPGTKDGDVVIVVIGSDKGLCSSFNSNIIREAQNFIKEKLSEKASFRFTPAGGSIEVNGSSTSGDVIKFSGSVDSKGIVKPTGTDDVNLNKPGQFTLDYNYKSSDGPSNSGNLQFSINDEGTEESKKLSWTYPDSVSLPITINLKLSNVLTSMNVVSRKINVLCVGKKIYGHFKKMNNPRVQMLSPEIGFAQSLPTSELNRMLNFLASMYTTGQVSSVYLLYTKYFSTARQKTTLEQFLPLGQVVTVDDSKEKDTSLKDYIFEPSPHELFQRLIPAYARNKVFQALAHSFTSEHTIRMIAMRNATDNAGELIDDLTLKRNKARQAIITKELSEIVGGAEALKG